MSSNVVLSVFRSRVLGCFGSYFSGVLFYGGIPFQFPMHLAFHFRWFDVLILSVLRLKRRSWSIATSCFDLNCFCTWIMLFRISILRTLDLSWVHCFRVSLSNLTASSCFVVYPIILFYIVNLSCNLLFWPFQLLYFVLSRVPVYGFAVIFSHVLTSYVICYRIDSRNSLIL